MQAHPILDASQIQLLDDLTKEKFHLPHDLLMELAGSKMADFIQAKHFSSFLILCGKGHNGADALVLTRHLLLIQPHTDIFLYLIDEKSSNPLFQLNFNRLKSISSAQVTTVNQTELSTLKVDCIIDGLFGTGLNRPLSTELVELIRLVNGLKSQSKISIDIPSGLNASTGEFQPIAFNADTILSIGPKKLGFFLNDGSHLNTQIETFSIGHDTSLIKVSHFEIESADHRIVQKNRIHKYGDGFVQIIAGSAGLSGAAYLACKAALAAGAPAVQLLYPKGLFPVFDCLLPEVIKCEIGEVSDLYFNTQHYEQLLHEIELKKGSLIIGPGMGRNKETIQLISSLLPLIKKPFIIDADALFAINSKTFFSHPHVILTPHVGELSQLSESPISSDVERMNQAKKIATQFQCSVFSKGTFSCICEADGNSYFLPFSNVLFRKTGYGDVFSGWLGRELLKNNSILDAIINTSFDIYSKAIVFDADELRPEHLIS